MKKLLLTLGSIAAVTAPVAAVVSCFGTGSGGVLHGAKELDRPEASVIVTRLEDYMKSYKLDTTKLASVERKFETDFNKHFNKQGLWDSAVVNSTTEPSDYVVVVTSHDYAKQTFKANELSKYTHIEFQSNYNNLSDELDDGGISPVSFIIMKRGDEINAAVIYHYDDKLYLKK